MGSSKPKGWPERQGGLHLFCRDKEISKRKRVQMRPLTAHPRAA